MEIIAKRIRGLRESIGLSQAKLGKLLGVPQASINRYENNDSSVPDAMILKYADYFDVSLDYLFGRTDNPQGKLYKAEPPLSKSYPQMEKFIEMCFDPGSAMNEKLKKTLLTMLKEDAQ